MSSIHRRLLFPNLGPDGQVPVILTTASQELNEELYVFIALALRGYVSPWWSKITRYDRDFIPQVSSIITRVIAAVYTSSCHADLPALFFAHIPSLFSQHYLDFRAARAKLGTSYAPSRHVFHQLQPHMAIDSEGRINAIYVRQVVEHILKYSLPPEEYRSEAERAIVCEVLVKVICVDVFPRLTQPWFIHKTLLDLLDSAPPRGTPLKPTARLSFQSVIVLFLSAVQYASGLCLALIAFYKQSLSVIKAVNSTTDLPPQRDQRYSACLLNTIAEVLNMKDRLTSAVLLCLLRVLVGFTEPFLDRLLPYLLYKHAITEPQIIGLVKKSNSVLFPNGYPGPPPVDPTPEEQTDIKNRLVERLEQLAPGAVGAVLLGHSAQVRRETILSIVEPLSYQDCNAHLFLFIFDLIIVHIFPSLAISFPNDQSTQDVAMYSTY